MLAKQTHYVNGYVIIGLVSLHSCDFRVESLVVCNSSSSDHLKP